MEQVYRLKEAVRFEPPTAWSIQARFALAYRQGEAFTAEDGRLVIYLEGGDERGQQHLYRLSDGRVGALDGPPDERFLRVADREVIALAEQVKTLPELVAQKGLTLWTTSRLDPFTLIACPMCGATQFSTVDLASVWCDACNARFQTRMTAGDPGVVVDAALDHYGPERARIIVPRSLILTIVVKDFGYSSHPEGLCGEYCRNSPNPEIAETRTTSDRVPAGLRSGIASCGLEVYDWTLYGTPERDRHHSPRPVYTDVDEENELIASSSRRICARQTVRSDRLPSFDLLDDGSEEEREWWYLADCLPRTSEASHGWHPVWWKVRAQLERCGGRARVVGWVVTDRTLCPRCLRPAAEGDHRWCGWDEMGWKAEGRAEG